MKILKSRGKRWIVRWISVSLSLQPPRSLVNELMDKVTMTEGMEAFARAKQNGLTYKDEFGYNCCLMPKLPTAKPQWALNMAPFPWGICQPPGGMLVFLDLFYHGRGNAFSYWNRWFLWLWICLSCLQCFCQKTTIYKCLTHPHVILHSTTFNQGFILWQIRCANEPSSWNSPCYLSLLSIWADRKIEWPFNNIVTIPVG